MNGIWPTTKEKANVIVGNHLILWPAEKVKEKAIEECNHWKKQAAGRPLESYWDFVIQEIVKMNI